VYLPYWQRDRADFALVVRTAMDPLAITPALRSAIHGWIANWWCRGP
jgi:hypothetical protein